ncbi:MAG: MurR/RpiR family transcriptional regulator [Firmicutes bacterium]|nr:MurR/RpiR family transcriptional regulator [Bacillota bacterium]
MPEFQLANPIQSQIRNLYSSLRPSERKVADFLLESPDKVIYLSISECAERCNVSETTIIRFARLLGLSGYQELKIELAKTSVAPSSGLSEEITPDDTMSEAITKALQANAGAIMDTLGIMDLDNLERAIQAMLRAKRVLICGFGTSGIAGQYLAYKLLRTGIEVLWYPDFHLQLMSTTVLKPHDIVVCISFSGSTKQVLELAELVQSEGIKVISITNYRRSPLAKHSDILLLTCSNENPFMSGAAASIIAQIAIIDALFIGLAMKNPGHSTEFIQKTTNTIKSQKV